MAQCWAFAVLFVPARGMFKVLYVTMLVAMCMREAPWGGGVVRQGSSQHLSRRYEASRGSMPLVPRAAIHSVWQRGELWLRQPAVKG